MSLLNAEQCSIIEKLKKGGSSLSAESPADINAVIAAGIPLRMDAGWVALSDEDILLDVAPIYEALSAPNRQLLRPNAMRLLLSVGSTNDAIKLMEESPAVLLTEQQERGRGRYGRDWSSPFAAGIYLSIKWNRVSARLPLGGLSLAIGVMIATALAKFGIQCGLKWPNDLMVNGEKLGGILVDLALEHIIIGVGINYRKREGQCALKRIWCQQGMQAHSRNTVVAALLDELLRSIPLFLDQGFTSFYPHWQTRDILKGTFVVVRNGTCVQGLCAGVNEHGALLINVDGNIKVINSGTLCD